jgi:hypothetical protein
MFVHVTDSFDAPGITTSKTSETQAQSNNIEENYKSMCRIGRVANEFIPKVKVVINANLAEIPKWFPGPS